MTAYITGIIGTWIFGDGLYSLFLYLGSPAYHGPIQTWRRDHWLRVCRMVLGLVLVLLGLLGT